MSFFKFFSCSSFHKNPDKSKSTKKPSKLPLEDIQLYAYSKMGFGRRKTHSQDSFCIMKSFTKDCHFFAIYDGHGHSGLEASLKANDYIEKHLKANAQKIQRIQTDKQFKSLLKKTFTKTEETFKAAPFDYTSSGTCCIAVLIQKNKCYVANLGDSKAVLCQEDNENHLKSVELSKDHKPSRIDEKNRIIQMGGKIKRLHYHDVSVGPYRVWGNDEGPGIAVSRSLGDLRAKEVGVIWEPEIDKIELKGKEKYIVIASDGLWDLMEVDEVTKFLSEWDQKGNDRAKSSEALVLEARSRWEQMNFASKMKQELEDQGLAGVSVSCDDITVIVAYLNFTGGGDKKSEQIVVDIG